MIRIIKKVNNFNTLLLNEYHRILSRFGNECESRIGCHLMGVERAIERG